jgi:hypothetical protein
MSTDASAQVAILRSALSAMLTHMGMDEDDWNKPTFDQARRAMEETKRVGSTDAQDAEPVAWPDAPKRIYLQVCDEPECGDTFQWHREQGEMCWCEDKINDRDVEYVRADLTHPSAQDAELTDEQIERIWDEWDSAPLPNPPRSINRAMWRRICFARAILATRTKK